jgi:hypothetical protein
MLTTSALPAGLLSGPARYLHWGVIQISVTNFVIIVAMVVVFALALIVPFPGNGRLRQEHRHGRR